MGYVDVHCHLGDEAFNDDLDEVILRARKAGLVAIITSSLSIEDAQKTLGILKRYRGFVYRTVGLDYTVLEEGLVDEVARYIEQNRNTIIGIGEVGLDYYLVRGEDRRIQRKIFSFWIEYSKGMDLPIIVHSRSAGRYALEMLFEHRAERVLMHAFDGRSSLARRAAERGYYFSIPPSIARSIQKQKLVKALPLENILLETDSPVLAPEKGVRNEPANVRISASWIAKIKGVPLESVVEVTYGNARALFEVDFGAARLKGAEAT